VKALAKSRIGSEVQATLILPAAWVAVDLSSPADTEASRLSTLWFTGRPPAARSEFVHSLAQVLREAATVGATFAAVLAGDGDIPVCASLVAADLSSASHSPGSLELEWTAAGRTCSRISLPVGPAVLSEQSTSLVVDSETTLDGWEMQIAIPALDAGGILLVFSTPLAALAESVRTVALAIASTLRWQREWR
jgi:hypothetical protein